MSDWIGGRRPVTEALAAGRAARRLLLSASAKPSSELRFITDAARRLHLPTDRVPADQLTRLAGFDGHQGLLLEVEERLWVGLDEILYLLTKTRLSAHDLRGELLWSAPLIDARRLVIAKRAIVLDGADRLLTFGAKGAVEDLGVSGNVLDISASPDGQRLAVLNDARRALIYRIP